LKEKPRWVCWKWEKRDGKWTKPPYDPRTNKYSESNDPSTWTTFEVAYDAYLEKKFDGIGFILNKEYTGIDFDDCFDFKTNQISEPSLSDIARLDSYTEISPSGTGLKTIVRGNIPSGHHDKARGIFDNWRFFCITGHVLNGVSKNIESRQAEIDSFYDRYWPEKHEEETNEQERESTPPLYGDQELLDLITKSKSSAKFNILWSGDWSEYPSQSEADFALSSILAFWTAKNVDQIDRLFRMSGLYRPKWDKHGYNFRTINKAIGLTVETYEGHRPKTDSRQDKAKTSTDPKAETKRDEQTNEKEAAEKGRRLKITTLTEIYKYPEVKFLIQDILPEETLNILGGYTGVGKSILALEFIKSIVTGEKFLGRYAVNNTGPVLIIDEETPRSLLKDRVAKMMFDPSWPVHFIHFQDVKIDSPPIFNELMQIIEEKKPVLTVFDSLIRIHKKKEKESEEMAMVIDKLRKITNSGTTGFVIHHHRKGGGPLTEKLRGSTDIPGGIDIEFALYPEKEGSDILTFQSVKTRVKPFGPIQIKLNITDEKAAVEYHGTQDENILDVVVSLLSGTDDYKTVAQIMEILHGKGFDDFKDYTVRKALKEGVKAGDLESQETRIKKAKAVSYRVKRP
jgi:hypothetical protein